MSHFVATNRSLDRVARARAFGRRRRGFTLVETMSAMVILALVGTSLLLGMTASTTATQDASDRLVALGMAQQLLDEISGMKYAESLGTEYETGIGPGAPEVTAGARRQYDDIDDYDGISTTPPTDRWGITLGADNGKQSTRNPSFQISSGFFTGWKQQVDVFYISDTNFSTKLTSGASSHRKIEVRILVTQANGSVKELAYVSRVVAYVPGS